jgi:hypothetical protein
LKGFEQVDPESFLLIKLLIKEKEVGGATFEFYSFSVIVF